MHQKTTQAIVTAQPSIIEHQKVEQFALFNKSGVPVLTADGTPSMVPVTTATAIGTAAKTTTSAEPAANSMVLVKFTNGNSAASPTVAFAGGTARAIQLGGVAPAAIEATIGANGVAMFWFDGTVLHQIGVYS